MGVSNAEVMEFMIEFRNEMRRALILQKLDATTPTEVRRQKLLKHLDALDRAVGLGSPWRRAGKISLMLKGEMPPPDGLEDDVRQLRRLECTQTQARIQQWLTRG